ncbi:hypothetical protein OPT61_g4074 [Boeremia exigua]|uniref:Uncharacterized protein n=1 Tax=Boeremia exigua TaxID=749465 RepID=A0ACC2IFJ8_9PLEO|nr:hypothetical protein OPT61_g4074 [Boeremia exigua]
MANNTDTVATSLNSLSEDDRNSPPRKRPRTKAPPQAAAPNTEVVNLAPQPLAESSLSTNSYTVEARPSEMHRFPVQPLNRFQGASASIKRPREVAHFSYNDNHEYRDDESSINYYVPPPMGADLREGFETFKHYEDKEDPHLDSLLRALMQKESKNAESTAIKADFVTWRGMMTKIMTAPYDNFAEFSMFATLHDGTIYLEEDFPSRAASRAAEASRPPPRHQHPDQQSQAMMSYWGYKFETLALIPTPPSTTPPDQIRKHQQSVTSNHAQHCSIVHTSFGPHTLLLGGEVDGLLGPKPTNPDDPIPWVEHSTSRRGRSWYPWIESAHNNSIFQTNIPDVGSKQHLGRLPNGDRFLVHNPRNNTERYRQPLTIATSRGGNASYTGIGVLRTNASSVIAPDTRKLKRLMFSYPTAILVGGKLVVAYSENKENIWVSVVDPVNLL